MPLEAINKASSYEKNIKNGHPSSSFVVGKKTVSSSWAVLFAQLVDDPLLDSRISDCRGTGTRAAAFLE